MPNSPSASFIPKQSPAKRSRYVASRQLHLLTICSYVIFTATLIASAGLFFYSRYLESKLTVEVEALNSAIAGFSEDDMNDVREFNLRLDQASQRLDKSVSLKAIFSAIEQATAKSVQITNFDLTRNEDVDYTVSAKLNTDSFDSSLFQRGLFEANSVIHSVNISDVSIDSDTEDDTGGVTFVAKVGVPLSSVPYTVLDLNLSESVSNPTSGSSTVSLATSTDSLPLTSQ